MNISRIKQFSKIDLRRIKQFEHKSFFEIADLEQTFPDVSFFIIKGKKNIGKTFSIIKKMEEIASKNKKFVLMRISEGEAKTLSREWNADKNIPFEIKAKRIFYEKKDCGQIVWLKNLQNERSQQFNDYEAIFFDEFVPFSTIVFGANLENEILLARNFVRFVIDVQRAKKDIKIFCFGNNETAIDIFAKYFRISLSYPIWENKQAQIIYWNLQNYYVGYQKTLGHKLAIFDENLEDYLLNNNSFEDINKLINYNDIDNSIIKFYFILNEKIYQFSEFLHKTNNKTFEKTNTFSIAFAPQKLITTLPIVALSEHDFMFKKEAVLWNKAQLTNWAKNIKLLIKFEKLKFADFQIKKNFENFLMFL